MHHMTESAWQQCIRPDCAARFDLRSILFACTKCGGLLDVCYDWSALPIPNQLSYFDARRGASGHSIDQLADRSGVWRFRELLPFANVQDLVTIGEGQTHLQHANRLAHELGLSGGSLFLQYEGFNLSGSFKDNGMAAAFTMARALDRHRVACASTGNTSAALALFAAHTKTETGRPINAIVFVGGGKIAAGKLAQALEYGALTIQIQGDFDDCMRIVQNSAQDLGLYIVNSINPFRLEGQKTIMYRVLEGLAWQPPDWIVVPGGNLGNSSAFGKAFAELLELGLVDRVPRLAVINATGANALAELYNDLGIRYGDGAIDEQTINSYFQGIKGRSASTIASAIEIGRPVNLPKALRSLAQMNGVVRAVPDEAIMDGKALVGRYGFGCEPASGATIAGLKLLLDEQVIAPTDRIVCVLTGHPLKDPQATIDYQCGSSAQAAYANPPVTCPADVHAIKEILDSRD